MSDIKVNPWIAIVISVVSLMISAATFAIQRITIRDFAYRVGHFNAQNLVGGTDQSNTAFSLQTSFINDGNEPVVVNKVEVFVINKPRTLDVSDVRDFDCDRQHIIPYWEPLYLYEPTTNIPQEGRGNATENSFGHKEVPAISVAPYSTVQDVHRFSLFSQLDRDLKRVDGLVCLDVTMTAIDGDVHRSPKALGLINAERGKIVDANNWHRIGPPILPVTVANEALVKRGGPDDPRSELVVLMKNFWWFL